MEKKKLVNGTIVIVSSLFLGAMSVMILAANKMMGNNTAMNRYYLKKTYSNSEDLLMTLATNPSRLFLWCCDCIQFYASKMGITYEQLNIHLFVIVQPMLIVMFFVLFIVQSLRLRNIGRS